MKQKKIIGVLLAAVMTASFAGCGSSAEDVSLGEESATDTEVVQTAVAENDGFKSYSEIALGEDFTDLEATITMFNHRTDMDTAEYGGKNWEAYLADFNAMYPGIKVEITTTTNYADDALTHVQSGDYETIMGIPYVDKKDLSTYFMSYGDLDTMSAEINYATAWEYDKQVYGVPSTATTQGIVYNKRVFEEAGVTELPKTPDEFIAALQMIKGNTDAIPLYTNYAAGWTMGAWDAYVGFNATGDTGYMNGKLIHASNPFSDNGNGTGPYAVYKILYDAVSLGLTEEDYTTTDWEGSKAKLNNGEIGCMVLGSWAYPQMEAAGENAQDVGYMAFPVSIDGKQYALAGADYSYGINVNASDVEKQAALVFVKWLTEMSGFSYNEDGLPVDATSTETKLSFVGVEFGENDPAAAGEEDFLNDLNAESELNINNGGDKKIQEIIEHASNKDMTFDDIMTEWNKKWADAQASCGIEVTE